MRRHHYALFFLILLVVILVVGWKRGWFTVNEDKVQRDEQQIKEKIKEGFDKVKPDSQKDTNK